MIKLMKSGKNANMRYLDRVHGVAIAWLHERFSRDDILLSYEVSEEMAADIFTKSFTNFDKWDRACRLINVVNLSLIHI